MKKNGEVFIGIDTAKARVAVAVADGDRNGEVRHLGEFDNTPEAVAKLVRSWLSVTRRSISVTRQVRPAMGCIASSFP